MDAIHRSSKDATLRRLMDVVARAKTLEEVYAHALEILRSAALVERAAILEMDSDHVMRFVAWNGLSDEYRRAVEGHSPWAPDDPEPGTVLVPDVESEASLAAFRDLFEREGIGGLAFVPLRFGPRLLGKFMLYLNEPRSFLAQEIEAAESIALTLAYAIEHRRIEQALEQRLHLEQEQRRLAEHESATRRALEQQARQAAASAERAERHTRTLAEASALLASLLSPDDILRQLASFVVRGLADYCVTYAFDGCVIGRLGLAHADPARLAWVDALERTTAPRLDDAFGAGAVIRTGEPFLAADITPEQLDVILSDPGHRQAIRQLDPRSSLVVPLQARGRTLGAMTWARVGPDARKYDDQDLRLAIDLANRAALLVDNARLYRDAQQAASAREEMMAIVSHDLRGPLNTIVTACAVLENHDRLDPERRGAARSAILRATERMERLIQDLLDVARLDGGSLAFSFSPVDVENLVMDCVGLFRPQVEAKGILLEVSPTGALPWVHADRDRVMQVLSNFLANAIEHVPPGGQIRVVASLRAENDHVRVAIHDTGPGIPADSIKHVFDRFWRAHPRSGKGTGLGLAIAKGIIDGHRGTIGCESEEGRGSSFYFDLPAAAVQTNIETVPLRRSAVGDPW